MSASRSRISLSSTPYFLRVRLAAAIALLAAAAGCQLEDPDLLAADDVADDSASIVGGAPASEGEYPFMAFVQLSGPWGSGFCGGTLVAPSLVLTAGHCVFNSVRSGKSLPGDVTVILGRTRRSDTARGEVISVSEIILHPWYAETGERNDVALLRLSRASVQPTIEIVSPYGPSDRVLWAAGVNATIVGWGRTSSGGPSSDNLLEAVVPILDDVTPALPDWYGGSFRPTVEVAAGYAAGGVDTCQGDSGGPLLVPSRNGWKQAGITSWGWGCADPKSPGVYTRIGALRLHRWIKSIIHETPHVGDVNGDGRADIVTFTHGDPATGPLDVWVALSTGTSFGAASVWGDWWAHRHHIPLLGDFNGDGRDDIFAFTEVGDAWVALSTGASFNGGLYRSPVIMDIDDVPMVGDVNGDLRDDIVIFSADSAMDVHVVLSTGAGFGSKTKWHDTFGFTGESFELADVNGDWREDIIVFQQGIFGGNRAYVALSNGAGFGPSSVWHSYFAISGEMPGAGDFDGDGDGDIVTFTRDALADVYVGLSNRVSGFAASLWSGSFGGARGTYRTGDVNSDGRADIIRFTQNSAADVFVALSSGSGFGAESLWHGYFAP